MWFPANTSKCSSCFFLRWMRTARHTITAIIVFRLCATAKQKKQILDAFQWSVAKLYTYLHFLRHSCTLSSPIAPEREIRSSYVNKCGWCRLGRPAMCECGIEFDSEKKEKGNEEIKTNNTHHVPRCTELHNANASEMLVSHDPNLSSSSVDSREYYFITCNSQIYLLFLLSTKRKTRQNVCMCVCTISLWMQRSWRCIAFRHTVWLISIRFI